MLLKRTDFELFGVVFLVGFHVMIMLLTVEKWTFFRGRGMVRSCGVGGGKYGYDVWVRK
jgi:hypothetical protein